MKTHHAILNRYSEGLKQTLGKLDVYDANQFLFSCYTLELPDKDNASNISCIPKGEYVVKPYHSAKYPNVYQIMNVENRDYILIHQGNYHTDIRGCIIVGDDTKDINGDGLLDVVNSKKTLEKLKDVLNYDEFKLLIV